MHAAESQPRAIVSKRPSDSRSRYRIFPTPGRDFLFSAPIFAIVNPSLRFNEPTFNLFNPFWECPRAVTPLANNAHEAIDLFDLRRSNERVLIYSTLEYLFFLFLDWNAELSSNLLAFSLSLSLSLSSNEISCKYQKCKGEEINHTER